MLHRSFLRMYFHRVSSRHWPSPLTHQDAARITQGLLLASSRMAIRAKKSQAGVRHRDSDYGAQQASRSRANRRTGRGVIGPRAAVEGRRTTLKAQGSTLSARPATEMELDGILSIAVGFDVGFMSYLCRRACFPGREPGCVCGRVYIILWRGRIQ